MPRLETGNGAPVQRGGSPGVPAADGGRCQHDHAARVPGPAAAYTGRARRARTRRPRRRDQLESGQAGVRVMNVNGQSERGTGTDRGTPAAARALLEQGLESMEFAATVPVITGLLTDPAGRIWVQRESGDVSRDGPIDLLTSGGAYIGTIANQSLPAAVSRSGWRRTSSATTSASNGSRCAGCPRRGARSGRKPWQASAHPAMTASAGEASATPAHATS